MQQATNSSGDSTLQNQNEIQITLHSTCSSLSNNHNENNVPKEDDTIAPIGNGVTYNRNIHSTSNAAFDSLYTFSTTSSSIKRSVTCDANMTSSSSSSPFSEYKRPRKLLKMEIMETAPTTTEEIATTEEQQELLSDNNSNTTLNAIWQLPSMIQAFDNISPNLKSYLLFQLLKRSSTNTLQFINSVIMPVLKHDFLSHLPLEISRCITSYLDAFSLARASLVCKKWRSIIDADQTSWKRLLLQYGYSLKAPQTTNTVADYKALYAKHHTLKQNWRKGRATETQFKGHDKFVVTCLQFDDKKIVSGADDSHVNIYDTRTGKKKMTLEGHEGGVWALQYVDNTLVTGSTDRRVRVWDMETGKCTHIFTGHTSTIRCLLITKDITPIHDTKLIITGSRDSILRVWKLPDIRDRHGYYHGNSSSNSEENPYFIHSLVGHRQSVRAIAHHGNIVVSGSYDNTVRSWDLSKGRMTHVMEGHTQKVYSVVIDATRNQCMSGSMDSTVRVWDLKTGDCLRRLEGHTVLVGLLGLTDQYLVSAAADSILRVWSPETGVCDHALAGHTNSITCFQHDDEKVISGSEGGLKMWDIKTGKFMRDLITDVDCVWRVAFDNRRCVAAVQKKNETSFRILDFGQYNMS